MKKLVGALALGAGLALAVPAAVPAAHAATPKNTLIQASHIDDIITLDPAEMYELSTYEVNGNVYENLVAINPHNTGEILHKAAESWSVSDDGKTYTFKLRPGMKFQSGNPVTAADVVYSFQRLTALNKAPAFLIQDNFGITPDNMKDTLQAVDPLTFKMTVDKAYAPSFVINVLCATNFAIVDSQLLKSKEAKQADGTNDWGNGWLKTNSAGSGPFMITQWKPNEVITMEANPNWYGPKPKLKRVVWRHIAEESSQRLLLESGDVDIARNLSADQLDGLRAKGGFVTTATAQNTNLYAGLNTKNQYLSNPKVREAIRYLVDYDGLEKTALREGWIINQTFLPNGVLGFVDSRPYKLDIAKAKALLTEAGYPNGFPLTVNVASTEQSRMDIAQSLQSTFAKVGIQLKILASDQKTVITTYRARKHDIALLTWGVDYFDPNTNMSFVVNTDNSDKPASKPLAWRNGWMDEAFNKQAAELKMERDTDKRMAGYQAMIKEWQPISPFAMMYQQNWVAALSPKVKNFFIGPSNEMTQYLTVSKQ
ncbi:MAG TPA: ABC transporter substrate-binding protein [Dongiaceae bacterium]|nr:ABC transporter substrate-binding protein [Dongiaceae bacterium]